MLNQVTLIGHVCGNPEIRSTQDGKSVANFSMATSERWKTKDGEKKEKTEFHRIVIFGSAATIAEKYVKKGSKISIIGALQTRKWMDKDGNNKYSTEIVLQGFSGKIILLDSKPSDNGFTGKVDEPYDENDEDIPF